MNGERDPLETAAEEPHDRGPEGLQALPGLARVAATAGLRTTGWALKTSLRASRRATQAAVSPPKAIELARDVAHTARAVADELNKLVDVDRRVRGAGPAADVARKMAEAVPARWGGARERDGSAAGAVLSGQSLRDEGELLLRRSRDVHYEFDAHPAYERILSELAPDEARILRLLLLEGPQPAVDVRTGGPLGLVRSRLIAPGLSMIGARAGCRYVERVPSYLNNLFRLGMVWFSRETLRDPLRYQVLEAQPEVLEAIHSVSQAKVVRRSIHLTPFGEDFCRVCLCPDDATPTSLPAHSAPPAASVSPQPPAEVGED